MKASIVFIAVLTSFCLAHAEVINDGPYTVVSGQDLSDQVAFWQVAKRMQSRAERYNRAFAIDNLQRELQLESEEETARLLDALIQADADIRRERDQNQNTLLCSADDRFDRERAINYLEALSDVNDLTLDKHMRLVKASLSNETAEKLMNYIRENKSRMVIVTGNYRAEDGLFQSAVQHVQLRCQD
jgi:hypothetical protein